MVFSLSLYASTETEDKFCGRKSKDIVEYLSISANRMAFRNAGGLFNGGVCWWHSRLQRSSAYLVKFAPEKARLNSYQTTLVLRALRDMNRVVEIPGFANFYDFTKANQEQIQSFLNDWQKFDGFFNMQWVRGISGSSKLSSAQMEAQMKKVYDFYKTSPLPVWIMAQIKGVTSHSFLVVNMVSLPRGYDFTVIDSNSPLKTYTLHYQFGDEAISHTSFKYTFVPYVGFQKDYESIGSALKAHCQTKTMDEMDHVPAGDIELSGNTGPQDEE